MKGLFLALSILCFCCVSCYAEESVAPKVVGKQTVGYMEKVEIYPGGRAVLAFLKPDLSRATLHAEKVKKFRKGGKRWVEFTLKDMYGETFVHKQKIARIARFKRRDGSSVKRIIVELGVCIGGLYVEGEVKLADRSGRVQRFVLGRDILAGNVIIDPALSHTVEPNCSNIPKDKRN